MPPVPLGDAALRHRRRGVTATGDRGQERVETIGNGCGPGSARWRRTGQAAARFRILRARRLLALLGRTAALYRRETAASCHFAAAALSLY